MLYPRLAMQNMLDQASNEDTLVQLFVLANEASGEYRHPPEDVIERLEHGFAALNDDEEYGADLKFLPEETLERLGLVADLRDEVDGRERERAVRVLLGRLPKRDRDIIALCFGIGCRIQTTTEVSKLFSMSPSAVRRVKQRTLKRLWRIIKTTRFNHLAA